MRIDGKRLFGVAALGVMMLAPMAVPAQTPVTAPAPGPDLSRIPRTLAKEPAYGAAPRYCLLVLGPEAKSRVWLVLDGNQTLYVDRNRNGNLTDPGEKVTSPEGLFRIGELVEADGKTRYTQVTVGLDRQYPVGEDKVLVKPFEVQAMVRGQFESYAEPIFSQKAEQAPIVHFGGPISMRVFDPRLVLKGQRVAFRCLLRTPGLGEQAETTIFHDRLPENVFPNLSIEFPTATGAPPSRQATVLKTRC
jgi:hypothetical protein